MFSRCLVPILAVGFFLAVSARAEIILVPSDQPTIVDAINASSHYYDTVSLEPGTYSGEGFRNIPGFGNVRYLTSEAGPDSTVIELEGDPFTSANIVIEGLTFGGGSTVIEDRSGGFAIRNCRFVNNSVAIRILEYPGVLWVRNCDFVGNDTAVASQIGAHQILIDSSLFLHNEVCCYALWADLLAFEESVVAYNDTVIIAEGNVGDQDCIYYNNRDVSSLRYAGCTVFWPEAPPLSGATVADPLFCDTTLSGSTSVSIYSPCLPANNWCGRIVGSVSVGCDCGNANMQMGIDVGDLTYLVAYLFGNGPAPAPYEAGETDGVAGVNVADISYLVTHLFGDGPAPVCP